MLWHCLDSLTVAVVGSHIVGLRELCGVEGVRDQRFDIDSSISNHLHRCIAHDSNKAEISVRFHYTVRGRGDTDLGKLDKPSSNMGIGESFSVM